jgi:hypothetical protein
VGHRGVLGSDGGPGGSASRSPTAVRTGRSASGAASCSGVRTSTPGSQRSGPAPEPLAPVAGRHASAAAGRTRAPRAGKPRPAADRTRRPGHGTHRRPAGPGVPGRPVHRDPGPPQAAPADRHLVQARAAGHHPGWAGGRRPGETGPGSPEAAVLLVGVEQYGEPAARLTGPAVRLRRQVAEQGGGGPGAGPALPCSRPSATSPAPGGNDQAVASSPQGVVSTQAPGVHQGPGRPPASPTGSATAPRVGVGAAGRGPPPGPGGDGPAPGRRPAEPLLRDGRLGPAVVEAGPAGAADLCPPSPCATSCINRR